MPKTTSGRVGDAETNEIRSSWVVSRSGHPFGESSVQTCGVPVVLMRKTRSPSTVTVGDSTTSMLR
jgi:hypothetical protein